jgi:long-chain acyl-CoA synthetase
VEGIKKFVLLDKELDHDDDELTATMKVRRKSVEEKLKDLIQTMYRR